MIDEQTQTRREIATRNAGFARGTAKILASMNITPNQISTLSMLFASLAGASFYQAKQNVWFMIAAVLFIQLRLLCNLFDGMLAVEYQKKSKVGELYNEVPDRISDALIILGAGVYVQTYAYAMDLAWAGVFLATMTAYIRVFGAALVKKHYFIGPMAKQHRMALISAASVASIFFEGALYYGLFMLVLGCIVTAIRRLIFIARDLKAA